MKKRRKRVLLSDVLIICVVVAVLFGLGGFLVGRSTAGQKANNQAIPAAVSPSADLPHYSCAVCGYSFNDLMALKMVVKNNVNAYYCPSCGELLTSNAVGKGNPLENMKTVDTYRERVIDNWE